MSGVKLRLQHLNNLTKLVAIPHLKTHYSVTSKCISFETNEYFKTNARDCPKCGLDSTDTYFHQFLKPSHHKHLQKKLQQKTRLTKFQRKQFKKLKKYQQQLIVTCTTCNNKVTLPIKQINKQQQQEKEVEIVVETPKVSTRKRKHKDMLAGIKLDAVKATQKELMNSTTPGNVIVIPDTPQKKTDDVIIKKNFLKKKAKKQKQANTATNVTNNVCDMKQQAKQISATRSNLTPLSTKKEKKKLKHKLKKLQDAIKNIEQNAKPTSSLKDFLSSISV